MPVQAELLVQKNRSDCKLTR